MARYVALLRGINVGGNNMIKMADLKACFEDGGFTDVATYIQSGNVLFDGGRRRERDPGRGRADLRSSFSHYDASVVIRSKRQMTATVAEAPKGFGADRDAYRYDAIFLKPPLTTAQAYEGGDGARGRRRGARRTRCSVLLAAGQPVTRPT